MVVICVGLSSGSLSSLRIAWNTPQIAPLKFPKNNSSRLPNHQGVPTLPSIELSTLDVGLYAQSSIVVVLILVKMFSF